MKLEQLVLKNFMGWSELDIDLSQYSGIVAILGCIESDMAHSNGTGKSSLINAINYALYGNPIGKALDGMIRQGHETEGYRVTLRFSHADVKYEIVRRKKAGSVQKTTFKDLTNDKPMSVSPEEFLCMPEVVWQNTVYSAQRNLSAFVDKTPGVRKDILTEIFGMNNYLALETKARQLSAKSETELANAQHTVDRLKAELSVATGTQQDIDTLACSIDALESDVVRLGQESTKISVDLSNLNQACAAYDRISDEIKQLVVRMEKLSSKLADTTSSWEQKLLRYDHAIEQCEEAVATPVDPAEEEVLRIRIQTAEQTRPALDEAKRSNDDTVQQLATATAEREQHEKLVWEYQGRIADLPTDKCPLCGTNMTEEHLNKHRAELQARVDLGAAFTAERILTINKLSINLQYIREEIARLSATVNSIPDLSRKLISAQQRTAAYHAAEKELQALREGKAQDAAACTVVSDELAEDIAKCEAELANKRASMPVVDDVIKQKSDLVSRKNEIEGMLSRIHPELDTLRHKRSMMQFQVESRAKRAVELESLETAVKAAELKRNTHLELVKAFGPSGIPTLILENCLTELQQYLDHYMSILSDGQIHVTFQTIKTNATTAKTSETLAIMVSDISGERDIALYSGGETVRIYLAIRLALAKLLYFKSGQKLGLLIIDEIADLDDAGLLSFVDLLKRIEGEFEQVFVVSHIAELKNSFESALVLSRDLEGNYVPV